MRIGAIVHLVVVYLFSGGVIATLYDRKFLGIADFLKKSYNYMWPILKSSIIALIILLIGVLSAIIIGLLFSSFLPQPFIETTYIYFFSAGMLFGGLFLLTALLFIDLLRVEIVRMDTRSVWLAARNVFSGLPAQFMRMIGGYLLFVLLYLALLMIFGLLRDFPGRGPVVVTLVQFVLLQVFVFLSVWIKFSRFAFLLRIVEKGKNVENTKMI